MRRTNARRTRPLVLLLSAALFLLGLPAGAQELTGTLRGAVKLQDGSAAPPGVLVTATSPALIGTRTTNTTDSGQWILRNLAPGDYQVTFELDGMATTQSAATVSLGQSTPVNVTLGVAAESETIVVSGELPSVLASSEVSTTYGFEEVNNLPIDRTPAEIAQLAPGLTDNTPNGGQVTISGGFAYDNVFLIDGVDANDNLFGSTNPAFIEDAIADIQVLTSGISAEYGRFSGGVVNVITKSGGNEFTGTLRADLENADWRETTPIEDSRGTELEDDLSETYSATLGGYLMRDRLWFFAAGRDESTNNASALFRTGIPLNRDEEEQRYQVKATLNLVDKHQIQGTFTDREESEDTIAFSASATPSTVTTRDLPSQLKVLRYSGILGESVFAEFQASEKEFGFRQAPATGVVRDLSLDPGFVGNTPFRDFFGSFNGHYNAPYFDGTDPEDRNNEQIAGSTSIFLDTASFGGHDIKVGFEDFSSFRTGGNSQSPTDWVLSSDVVRDAAGNTVVDANGEVTPDWISGTSLALNWLATRGAEVELQTTSFYVNDRWQLNDNWSFNIGLRYEDVNGETNSNITTVDTSAFVPRLGASYDVRGDGKIRFDATFSEYAGKYSESQFAQNTDVGNPALLGYVYEGPRGQGFDFAPAYDINNYRVFLVNDGTQNVVVDEDINSPVVEEITLSAGVELARGGFLKAVYTDRSYSDFVEDFNTPEAGSTEVVVEGNPAGTFNNTFITNSNLPSRDYKAIQLIGRYRLGDNWTLDGNYTFQIENEGNFEGEGTNTPGISSVLGDYPEIRSESRHFPVGALNDFAESKLRVWTNYSLGLGRAGSLNFALLANWDSGRTFSATDSVSLSAIQNALIAANYDGPGPANQTVFFEGRGNVEFDDSLTFDLGVNYQLPIASDFELWIKADVINIFNDDTQIAGDTNVDADTDGPVDALGIPLNFTTPTAFLSGRNNGDFVEPFEYRFTVGFRF
ncbi:MAG: TonB-dependent receptor [Acidobacteriota bacterium]